MNLDNLTKFSLLAFVTISFLSPVSVSARGNDFTITDGQGEEIQVKNPLFGKKVKVIKDRMGNGYAQEKGLLGSKDTELKLLGNKMQHHKGLLGNSELSGSTIFGDKIVSKKGIFGRRKTTVDVSGTAGLIKSFFGGSSSASTMPLPILPDQSVTPSAIPAP